MKEVFRSPDHVQIALFQSLLTDAGIPYFVRNESSEQSVVGGVATALFPLPDFWPALCVLHDEDYPAAMDLLRVVRETPPTNEADWTCAACGESNPGNFTSCWSCQADRPS